MNLGIGSLTQSILQLRVTQSIQAPRPKRQPVVLSWMWISIIVNGAILSIAIIVVYIIALDAYVGSLDQNEIADAVGAERE
jgi:hypothetical protein